MEENQDHIEEQDYKTLPGKRAQEQALGQVEDEELDEELEFATLPGQRDREPGRRFRSGDVILGRYRVLGELGQGGMGVVYKCFDEVGGIEVALKALPPELSHNEYEMEDVRRNFQLVEKLHHPNIADIKTLEKDKGKGDYYLIMELAQGKNLRSWLRKKQEEGEVKQEEVISILRQIAEALDYAHGQKIIHRDIKPGNIMIDENGEVKVLDFGLAAQIHTSMTRVSLAYRGTSGTGPYMAPEQWRGRPQDAAADQYALAVMAYEMLSGSLPFDSQDANILRGAVLNEEAPEVEGASTAVQKALKRGLAKEAKERYENCVDFVRALGGEKVRGPGKRIVKAGGKKTPWAVIAAAAALVLLIGGYWLMGSGEKRGEAKSENPVVELPNWTNEEAKEQVVILQVEAETQRERVKGLSREDGIGKSLDEIEKEYKIANNLQEGNSYEAACKHYAEVTNLCGVVIELDGIRKALSSLENQISDERARAREKKAEEELKEEYAKLERQWNQATEERKAGKLKEAKEHLEALKGKYTELGEKSWAQRLDRHLKAAQAAEKKSDWETVKEEAAAVLEMESGHSEAEQLKKRADTKLAEIETQKKIDELLAKAKEAKKRGDWEEEERLAGEVLKLKRGQREAEELLAEAKKKQEELEKKLAEYRNQAKEAKERGAWEEVKNKAQAVLNLRSRDSEAQELIELADRELEKQAKQEKIERYLSEARSAKSQRDWKTVKSKAEEVLKIENGHSEAEQLKKEADEELKPKTKEGANRTVQLGNNVKLDMIWIEPGSFMMGSPSGETGRSKKETQHWVTLTKGYWLGKYEVTQEQYKAIMRNNPSKFEGNNLPVEQVTWDDAMDFCAKLTEQERAAGRLPKSYEYTLPTEAQWEYACRAGTETAFNNGTNISSLEQAVLEPCPNLDEVGWYWYNSNEKTHPVGQKLSNAWGLYDMHGNVWEWCLDCCDLEITTDTYRDGIRDPLCKTGSIRVVRGGGWNCYAEGCRSARRYAGRFGGSPGGRIDRTGFRVCLSYSSNP